MVDASVVIAVVFVVVSTSLNIDKSSRNKHIQAQSKGFPVVRSPSVMQRRRRIRQRKANMAKGKTEEDLFTHWKEEEELSQSGSPLSQLI